MSYTLVPTELIVDGAITSAKLDTNIAISGTLGVTGEVTLATHLIMGDNDKIKIGTGGDLEIYHDGSNSYIANSTGNIYIADTNGAVHIQAKLNEESIVAAADGAVTLYHDNSAKLATASGGVTVTGTLTATTLAGTLSTAAQTNITSLGTLTNFRSTGIDDNADALAITIDSSEDTTFTNNINVGGIGHVNLSGSTSEVSVGVTGDTDNSGGGVGFAHNTSTLNSYVLGQKASMTIGSAISTPLLFVTNNTERMRLDSSGNVGIGNSSPSSYSSSSDNLVVGTSGDTGITIVSGTVSNGQLKFADGTSGDATGRGIIDYNHAADSMAFKTAATERMRIDSSGNVSIGTTSTTAPLRVKVATDANFAVQNTSSTVQLQGINDAANAFATIDIAGNPIKFSANGSESMRIGSSGNIFIGTTSGVRGAEMISIDGGAADVICMDTTSAGLIIRKTAFTNTFLQLFEVESNGFDLGSITTNGSTVSYTSASDYRLKENVQPMENGLNRLKQLNPVKFEWKGTGKQSEGFIAHEVDEIYSDCVEGEKDGERMQTLDYGKITPLLVKAIQEQQTVIEDLKTRIETLEG